MKINLFIFILICFITLILLPIGILFFTKKHVKLKKILMVVFSCFYFIVLIVGTTCTIKNEYPNLFFYFDFNQEWLSINFLFFNFGLSNILINLGMLIPIGFIIYGLSENNYFIKIIIYSIIISLIIELYQFILPINRDTEIGDFIMNSLSGLFSAISCKLLKKYKLI